ncbi:hypothetical protein C2869_16300 [Saccharobesus litoralis]|uniref:Uncharacterized protein n=1 Tax=Saccharobesus litoralis TaxID=2172099 RepID=A0A2S0VUK3_9ALTE|nr:hypothetical protein [Saccharobesus litoralis]AWB67889.1 hypothetical protein C2869_16300 [Saccharobesus litoralis]
MNKNVTGLQVIDFVNQLSNAFFEAEREIHGLNLQRDNYDFNDVWLRVLDKQFKYYTESEVLMFKQVAEVLISALCEFNSTGEQTYEQMINESIMLARKDKQLQLGF